MINIDKQRIKACNKYINSHVILVSIDKMRSMNVFWHYKSFLAFWDLLFVWEKLYSTTATRCCRFENPNSFLIFFQCSVMNKLLHILRKHICHWAYFIIFPKSSMHSRNVFKHIVLSTKIERTRKMIHLLITVHFFEYICWAKASPK